ncbi:MAG: aldo/keto reductase [Deltaproteobacteria bacterium]|nr:aldo/keto reductase [Deltaproteobacteria bacterium]
MTLTQLLERHGKVGLGGEGVLRTHGRNTEARIVIEEAIARGITYFDSAHVYADSELYYGYVWRERPEVRGRVFQTSKSATRNRNGALADLESTLERMGTDYLDLWQIHDVRTQEDLDRISAPGGALEAFVEAKSSGKVKYVGVTGHHDPNILTQAVEMWPVDAVMMPVNPVEAVLGGFLTSTLPAAKRKEIAVIGMKILGGSLYLDPLLNIPAEALLRFALSFDVTVAIVGCSTRSEVSMLADVKNKMAPLSETEFSDIEDRFRPYLKQLAFYRGVL